MASPPTYTKVHEWLMKSPDPPRQSRERTVASPKPKPLPTSSPKHPSHDADLQPLSMIRKDAESKPTIEDNIDKHKPDTTVNDDKDERGHTPKLMIEYREEVPVEGEEHDDAGSYTNCLPSSAIWEDALILTACAAHWLTVMALVCFLAGLIIVWKTGYRLGLRTHSSRI